MMRPGWVVAVHSALLAALSLSLLALAGCSGDDHTALDDVTCPDGTVLTGKQIEEHADHHADGFDPATLCPVPPKVTLTGLPATVQVYRTAAFTWTVDSGSAGHGHSMLTSIRYAAAAVPDAEATLAKYPNEVIKKEHQNLPVTFKGNLTFNAPGKVYVRAYAQVEGDGLPRRDVWSPEVVLEVLPVQPTGTVHEVAHAAGPVGDLQPAELDAALGDAIAFRNDDIVPHTLEIESAPDGAAACSLEAGAQATSAATCVLTVPGSYTFRTDDVQEKHLRVDVALPAA